MKDENDKVTIDCLESGLPKRSSLVMDALKSMKLEGVSDVEAQIGQPEDVVSGRAWAGSKTPDRKRSKWETPLWMVQYLELRQKARFEVDAAASDKNHKAPIWYTEETDGLSKDWGADGKFIFLNPPYDDIIPWVEKAIEQIKAHKHITIQIVLPNDNSTYWYRLAAINATEVINLIHDGKNSGRVGFIDPDTGKAVNNNNKGTQIFTLTGKGKMSRTVYVSRVDMERKVESDYQKVFGDGSQ